MIGKVDFNKCCEESKGKTLPPSGVLVEYFLCSKCNFCFAPAIAKWTIEDFKESIYNADYELVDPDYLELRPRSNAAYLQKLFGKSIPSRHLDYGGGNGLLSQTLNHSGWNSISYDPLIDDDLDTEALGKFDLITAYEVFEHVPDPQVLLSAVSRLLAEDGMLLFSTQISDGNLVVDRPITWWYAAPRNGHISLFSLESLKILGLKHGLVFVSYSTGLHSYSRPKSPWANYLREELNH